ncbi:hypothetical protein EOJ36_09185 [Sandaracinomonas limnophila]|uniref:YdhG-like domain-containing protein n=1 Tax=Sandaracinomonas limnophila TaxID=1862386 RepID=A0A437PP74_9BACT|nr:DUF1801 domain-containing protein [Sandaracinomonas limnophila]RVU24092.1 hypothetical protein EOJ36_09185 [Sandaracinomonas limnophila]
MSKENPKVNSFFVNLKKWREEMDGLRGLILSLNLEEDLKWNAPCYMLNGKNVVIIQGFKEYFALMFFKGALLKDPKKILKTPGNVQAGRQIRFTSLDELITLEEDIKSYILEAIALEESGAKVEMKQTSEFPIPPEFQEILDKNEALKTAFEKLTPGRQKAYCMHFNDAKQTKTRLDRIEKYTDRILKGKGIMDCVCGLSKRMPTCDGSHKQLKQ